ncbi:glycoside hydrolase family 3 protein [Dothidotthia symphoricarpi CBS 119687]|uniref:beta-glucosidase n=1 Tax=Dothidotthia symphoricarpi CBS 119687 TaxID=1392245 RepID=A0A6A6AHY1_9PLEO|nr:glycoside hydrolase family 3 protein [Dothidotthia symphoricarpi CBS 119687]KAF2131166.1 glycoside hydrolase family 3 protein [Dothidotthia symphoricarpi CBS 119687]
MRYFSIEAVLLFAGCILPSNAFDILRKREAANATYKDSSASVDARVSDLLSRMTIEEKTAQLIQGDISNWLNTTTNEFNSSGLVWNFNARAGQFYVGYAMPPSWISEGIKRAQDYLLHNTTLGIPALTQTEGIHGVIIGNATIFNSPIAHACSWDPELIHEMAVVIATESQSLGINQLFAPIVDLARELRYGRVEETYGEDQFLAGEMGYQYVKGVQSLNVSATVKHFAGFSAPEQGLNTGPVHGGERELRTTWLPSFKRAIIDAGAWSIMGAYHSYDGIPSVANSHLQETVLREEWGYNYWVTSDAGATDRLCCNFKLCQCKTADKPIDRKAVTLMTLPNGNDVEMGGGSYNYETIPQLVEEGLIDIDVVNRAVARQLRAKFEMGLFENPYKGVSIEATKSIIHAKAHVELARKIETESIVLLENKNRTLPLSKSANIAVIGPMGNFTNLGDYVVYRSQYNPTNVTPLQGIQDASNGTVTFAQGCERWSNDQSGFPDAVAAAEAADVAVVLVGTWSRDQNELWQGLNATTGEHVDVASLNLVGAMGPLVQAIIETGKPTIVVYSSGKPVTEPWISESAAALVQQFYPGEQGGAALADILFGDVNPSGKLSVSFPYDVGTLPIYYDFLNSGRYTDAGQIYSNGTLKFGHQYVLNTPQPLYEFGYGLSYANFTYSNITFSKTEVSAGETITATVSVTNEASVDGKEVVQVYVQDVLTSVVVPNIELKGFKKVLVKAGETVDVSVELDVANWGLWNGKMQYVVEKGEFLVHAGSSSKDLRTNGTVTVV